MTYQERYEIYARRGRHLTYRQRRRLIHKHGKHGGTVGRYSFNPAFRGIKVAVL